MLTGVARFCRTCVNDGLTLSVFRAVSLNIKSPLGDSDGELGLAGDDGELHLLSLMLPLQLSMLNIINNSISTFHIILNHCIDR